MHTQVVQQGGLTGGGSGGGGAWYPQLIVDLLTDGGAIKYGNAGGHPWRQSGAPGGGGGGCKVVSNAGW